MLTFTVRRLVSMIPLAALIIVLTFSLLSLIPGDPALALLGPDATPDAVARVRLEYGLDDPWPVRLLSYAQDVIRGDLGMSIIQGRPVAEIIGERLPATIELAVASLFVAVLIGLTLGILAALRQGSVIDIFAMLFAQIGVSMPVYWMAILLVLILSINAGVLPAIGRGEPILGAMGAVFRGDVAPLGDSLSHILLPALALGANSAAIISRLVRSTMLDVLNEEFVRTARAKGLLPRTVILRHALQNAMLPIISVIGLRFGMLLSSTVVTEAIFAWPGLGQLTITAISQRDLPLIQGIVLVFGLLYAFINLAVDLISGLVDPRVRLG